MPQTPLLVNALLDDPGSNALSQLSEETGMFVSFHYSAFRNFWIGLMGVSTGNWLQVIVVTLALQNLRHRSVDVATFSIIQALAFLILARAGGRLADRLNRPRLLIATHLAFALCAMAAAVLLQRLHAGNGHADAWPFLLGFDILAFANGAILAVDHPTRQALLPNIVPSSALSNAIALNSLTFVGAAAFGPLLSSPLVALMSASGICWLRAALMLIMVAILRKLPTIGERTSHTNLVAGNELTKSRLEAQESAGGWNLVWQSPELRIRIAILAITGLLVTSFQVLLPVFALHSSSSVTSASLQSANVAVLGWMRGAAGAGALVGGLLLASRHRAAGTSRLAICCSLLNAGALVVFAGVDRLPIRLMFLTLAGGFAAVAQASIEAQLQFRTPAAQLGRVMSVFSACVVALWPIGGEPLAAIADFLRDKGFGWAQSAQITLLASLSLAICGFLIVTFQNRRLFRI